MVHGRYFQPANWGLVNQLITGRVPSCTPPTISCTIESPSTSQVSPWRRSPPQQRSSKPCCKRGRGSWRGRRLEMWGWIQKPWQEGDESQNWGEKNRKLWGNIHYTKNIWGGILALNYIWLFLWPTWNNNGMELHGLPGIYFWGDEQMNIHL